MKQAVCELRPHVVIIGAGFGGLSAAEALGRVPVDVTVIDRENHHLFQPLLYQVAMAQLSAQDVAAPTRSILRRHANTTVLLAEVVEIELEARRLRLDAGELGYDFLVIASGAETSYFGHDDWRSLAPGLKNLDDAIEVRRRVLLAFELAEREGDAYRRRALLNFVVIGGGPTGVELAGALAELARGVAADFRAIDATSARVHLIEAGPRVLGTFEEDLSRRAKDQLEELGVNIITSARVVGIDESGVELASGTRIPSSTVVWAAGVRPTNLVTKLDTPHDHAGRIVVGPNLSLPGHPEAFAIGDVASFVQDGETLPGVSPVAKQEGRAVAESIACTVRGKTEVVPFRYVDKGMMATIGRSRAIAQVARIHLSGWLAWVTWLVVHIWYLIGFRNRLAVLLNWAWTYLTFRAGTRVITGVHAPPLPTEPTFRHGRVDADVSVSPTTASPRLTT
jgi:NADH dehydrogenase